MRSISGQLQHGTPLISIFARAIRLPPASSLPGIQNTRKGEFTNASASERSRHAYRMVCGRRTQVQLSPDGCPASVASRQQPCATLF